MRRAALVVAIALVPVGHAGMVLAACSPAALDAVRVELQGAAAPDCGTKPLRRVFKRARRRAAGATAHAGLQCAFGGTARIAIAHRALLKGLAQIGRLNANDKVPPECAVAYETVLLRLDADLTAAENGIVPTTTTTTTAPPGVPTTTTLPACTVISLEVDRSDCTRVTSAPAGLVDCSGACAVKTFAVPAFGSLQLLGTPAPGDAGVLFGGDCGDDGTVPLGDAIAPDCSLSCDCSSGF